MSAKRRGTVLGWSSERTINDVFLAVIIVGGHLAVVIQTGHGDWLGWVKSEQRLTVYSTGAGVIAILGGLSAVALALYQSAEGTRALAVRRHYGTEIRRNWRALLIVAGATALLCLIAQGLDRVDDPMYARFLFEFALALAIARFIRLVWLFDSLLHVADADLTDPPRPPAPEAASPWKARRHASAG